MGDDHSGVNGPSWDQKSRLSSIQVEGGMIDYEDFDLRISADGDGFNVSARRGAQSASEAFNLDLSRSWDLWQPEEREPTEAKDLGRKLFEVLIRGSVRTLYDEARGKAGDDPLKGVRIRIHLEPRESRLGPLLRVPWEILFDPVHGEGQPHGLDPRIPIVRMLESAAQTLLPPSSRPIRILVALADPRHPTKLDLEGERKAIESALVNTGIQTEELQQVTRAAFQGRIRDGHFHIVHYLGHGDFAAQSEEGSLLLEGPNRAQDPLPASELSSYFLGRPMPRLVVLNACHTAAFGRCLGIGPYAGVAAALVGKGLPAVLAMQTAVRDRSAVRFTKRLYERIAAGDSVEEAVVEGRKELAATWPATLDWAVPVLFVREKPVSLLPRDGPLEKGVALFLSGRYREGLRVLDNLQGTEDASHRALLYRQLCRIASTPSLPFEALRDIDIALQQCLETKDLEIARLAKLALGIHRLDRMEPCRVRASGIPSSQLFQELQRSTRSPTEMEIAQALGASRDARVLFNLRR
jgi:hypothetical protein